MEGQRQRSLRAKNLDRREEGGSTDTCWTTIVVVQGTGHWQSGWGREGTRFYRHAGIRINGIGTLMDDPLVHCLSSHSEGTERMSRTLPISQAHTHSLTLGWPSLLISVPSLSHGLATYPRTLATRAEGASLVLNLSFWRHISQVLRPRLIRD